MRAFLYTEVLELYNLQPRRTFLELYGVGEISTF